MKPKITFDRTIVTVLNDAAVNLLVELAAPPAPQTERPPLDIVLVIDKSGSMNGEPIAAVKTAVSHLLRLLGTDDRAGVVAFDSDVELVLDLSRHDADAAIAKVNAVEGGGMTNLSGGWLKALEMLEGSVRDNALRRIVLLTDGQANVGETNPDRLCTNTSTARARNVTTSTIGFGDSYDERLLSAMADSGAGNDYWCAGPDQAPQIFNDEFEGLASVVAQNVSVELRPSAGVIGMRVLNEFPITEVSGGVQIALGDAYGDEHRRVIAELLVPPVRNVGPYELGEIIVRWTSVGDDIELHTTTIPIGIGVSSDPDAVDPGADPAVTEQVNILRAAEERRKALDAINEGDFGTASMSLDLAADLLTGSGGDPMLINELRMDSARLQSGEWDDASSKKQWSTRRTETKGRKRRYDE
jgi:Ca-activated chloride channel family protein